jgi:hypothetical protein
MNNDCFSIVTQFLPASEAVKLNTETAVKNFPKKVVLKTFREVDEFIRWCDHFDTSNLEEVTYQIYDMRYDAPRDRLIGWVPHGVKVLRVDVYNEAVYAEMPETVEELHLGRVSGMRLVIPDHVKRVTLEEKFNGEVAQWPAQMDELVVRGWGFDDGNEAYAVDNLPEGLRRMHLSWGVPIEVRQWPTTLEELTIVESDDDMLTQWLGIQHTEVPNGVEFTHTRLPSVNEYLHQEDDA